MDRASFELIGNVDQPETKPIGDPASLNRDRPAT